MSNKKEYMANNLQYVICRAHSFPRAAEFWAEPWNLPFAAEFCGIWEMTTD